MDCIYAQLTSKWEYRCHPETCVFCVYVEGSRLFLGDPSVQSAKSGAPRDDRIYSHLHLEAIYPPNKNFCDVTMKKIVYAFVCTLLVSPLATFADQQYVAANPPSGTGSNPAPAANNSPSYGAYPAPQYNSNPAYAQPQNLAPQQQAPQNSGYTNSPGVAVAPNPYVGGGGQSTYTNQAPRNSYGYNPYNQNPYGNNPYAQGTQTNAAPAGTYPNTYAQNTPAGSTSTLPGGINPVTGQPMVNSGMQNPNPQQPAPAPNQMTPTQAQPGVAAQNTMPNQNVQGANLNTPYPATNPAYTNGANTGSGAGSAYTDQEKQAWMNSCVPATTAPNITKVAQAFCLCGWQHISSGQLPINLLTSTNPSDIQQRQNIMQAISEACAVQLTANNQIQ